MLFQRSDRLYSTAESLLMLKFEGIWTNRLSVDQRNELDLARSLNRGERGWAIGYSA
jgi:hypothetical protein